MNEKVFSALIGLVGAINNNGKTSSSDAVIKKALMSEADDNCIEEIHQEKFRVSPNCASCQSPCGNTSDYPLEYFRKWSDEQKKLKEEIANEILRIVKNTDSELPDIVLKGITYMGYDLKAESYKKLLEEMKHWH